MSLLLNQLLSHAKARSIILLSVALLVVAVLDYLISNKPDNDKLDG